MGGESRGPFLQLRRMRDHATPLEYHHEITGALANAKARLGLSQISASAQLLPIIFIM